MGIHADTHSQRTRHAQWMVPACQTDLASIIIPTFNRATLLNDALVSAAAQIYRPLEIIVVDDGSTDNTPDVIRHWQEQLKSDPAASIRYFQQPNSGVSAARNRGLIESRGEFIQFLDSDDLLHPQKLSLQIAGLRQFPQCGLVFSDRKRADIPNQWPQIPVAQPKVANSADLYCSKQMWLTMVGVYRRATCCEAGPFCEDMNLGEDEEFNLRATLATASLVYLPGAFCALRQHSGPRLTDAHKGRSGLIHAVRMYRRMMESAAALGRLNDPPLVSALTRCLTDNIIGALDAGWHDVAADAIKLCRKLPIEPARRARLTMYRVFSTLPRGTFPRLWPLCLKFRQAVLEITGRKASHFRNPWKVERPTPKPQ